ncbi:MAG: hypothetical protein ACRDN9_12150 [Streptosporangiaceae bacterium]
MSDILSPGDGGCWQLSASGLPEPPKPLGEMTQEEWHTYLNVFLRYATTKINEASQAGAGRLREAASP